MYTVIQLTRDIPKPPIQFKNRAQARGYAKDLILTLQAENDESDSAIVCRTSPTSSHYQVIDLDDGRELECVVIQSY